MATPDMPTIAPGLPDIGGISCTGEASGTTGFTGIGSMGPDIHRAMES